MTVITCDRLTSAYLPMSSTSDKELKMLIVDDDVVDRMALCRTLKDTALLVSISEANDAEVALSRLDSSDFDCIFLDDNLPGRNGLQLVRQIRKRGIRVPVIALTSQGDEQTAVDLMKAGASDYLPKSKLSAEVLARSVRSSLRVYRAELSAEQANRSLREKNALLESTNRALERQRRHIHQQNLQLQEVSRLKSEFLATMSHELRTPLNAIIGFSQILISGSKGVLNTSQASMVERVLANGRNLLDLINDILTFSKIEAGRIGLDVEEVNLSKLVCSTVGDLQALATQKSLPVEIDIQLKQPMVINDSVRLRQILVNLLSNAIKFTQTGGIKVRVSEQPQHVYKRVSDQQDNEDRIFISVKDTGCGISSEEQDYIFDPFHQADQKVTRKHAGTGLGLAIINSLVKIMDGNIRIESEVGQGTTFTVDLPRQIVPTCETLAVGEFVR